MVKPSPSPENLSLMKNLKSTGSTKARGQYICMSSNRKQKLSHLYLPAEQVFFILSTVSPIWKFPQGGGMLSQRPFKIKYKSEITFH